MDTVNLTASWNPVRVQVQPGAIQHAINRAPHPAVAITGPRLRDQVAATGHATVESAHWAAVQALAADLRRRDRRCVIAIGGGSVMDATKVACAMADTPETLDADLDDLVAGRVPLRRTSQLWAIPTTAGTGSEVTKWSSIWTENGWKVSVEGRALYPDTAILDSALTASMSARLTAATGLDATAHAVESIWSTNHRPESDQHATDALRLIAAHLPLAVSAPDPEHRAGMSIAALHSGLALSWCRSTAPHALSYPLTGLLGIEHGLAVGLMLLAVLPVTEHLAPDRVALAAQALGVAGADGIAAFIRDVFHRAGLGTRLREFGVTPEFLEVITGTALTQPRFANHPGRLAAETIHEALNNIL
ncbi:phosphonoacetaldehyde reductase [Amycolatopsis sp. K13G38]|uniref:Phosphonoacetaldehyde reductase n=1 Tax=Amycolatopsis acididurans TaxID=2724524 RepID=A0ABX1JEP0_9PSEU|nr:iron-containing alcohol dehydrogenase [Amycolatopsis acididurans]NKQ58214.1 phosphonoacetaldehyde reductase [Amycolatopsis acididurans]